MARQQAHRLTRLTRGNTMKIGKGHLDELVHNWLAIRARSKTQLGQTKTRLRQQHTVSAGPNKGAPRKLLLNLRHLWTSQSGRG